MKKKVVLIIQARMGSIRLPGKSMMKLAGNPLVGRILERVKRVKKIDAIVLATSNQVKDDVLVDLANEYGVSCFRGSETDLVDRYYKAAKYHKADVVLRLPADNPCPEPSEYDRLIDYHLSSTKDFSSNICNFMGNGYPDGIGVEAFTFDSLWEIWKVEKNPLKREHIALNYYDYINDKLPSDFRFSVGTVCCPKKFSRPDIVLDVNTEKDYHLMNELYKYLVNKNSYYTFTDVIEWFDEKQYKENKDGRKTTKSSLF
jgi:spore coat polysaccharide biosynthesis protein SpsF